MNCQNNNNNNNCFLLFVCSLCVFHRRQQARKATRQGKCMQSKMNERNTIRYCSCTSTTSSYCSSSTRTIHFCSVLNDSIRVSHYDFCNGYRIERRTSFPLFRKDGTYTEGRVEGQTIAFSGKPISHQSTDANSTTTAALRNIRRGSSFHRTVLVVLLE